MSHKLPVVSGEDMVKFLIKQDFAVRRQTSRHIIVQKEWRVFSVPLHRELKKAHRSRFSNRLELRLMISNDTIDKTQMNDISYTQVEKPRLDHPSPASRACSNAPVRSPTGSGRRPGNHGQPGGVIQVLTFPDWGIANAGL